MTSSQGCLWPGKTPDSYNPTVLPLLPRRWRSWLKHGVYYTFILLTLNCISSSSSSACWEIRGNTAIVRNFDTTARRSFSDSCTCSVFRKHRRYCRADYKRLDQNGNIFIFFLNVRSNNYPQPDNKKRSTLTGTKRNGEGK